MVEGGVHTVDRIPETRAERRKLFNAYDPNGNNLMSLAELDRMIKLETVFFSFDHKPAIMRAYKKADEHGSKKYEGLITRKEFQYFIKYLQIFKQAWDVFDEIDKNDDRRINRDEFFKGQEALGLNMNQEECEKTFKEIDTNDGGIILFIEFCDWVIANKIDFEDDDEPGEEAKP